MDVFRVCGEWNTRKFTSGNATPTRVLDTQFAGHKGLNGWTSVLQNSKLTLKMARTKGHLVIIIIYRAISDYSAVCNNMFNCDKNYMKDKDIRAKTYLIVR